MAQRDKTHLIVSDHRRSFDFTPVNAGGSSTKISPPVDRTAHGGAIRAGLEAAEQAARSQREQSPISVPDAVPGTYVVFESFPDVGLALKSLDPRTGKKHPELRSVHIEDVNGQRIEVATVFVPEGKMKYFLNRLDKYLSSPAAESPPNGDLIDRIQAVHRASVQSFWTDSKEEFPSGNEPVWWEVWLRCRDGKELSRLRFYADSVEGMQVGRRALGFGTRTVVLVCAAVDVLASAMDVLDDIAELRHPHYPAEFLADEDAVTQADFVRELAQRVVPASGDVPAVCVIDTGVHQPHPLLSASLEMQDCHVADSSWHAGLDDDGHGTKMAGLALYGSLSASIDSAGPIVLRHKLESLKLLPPPSKVNPPELYGAITAAGASTVETGAPHRLRVYSMAITATAPEPSLNGDVELMVGQPTSWSASIDALAAGRGVVESTEPEVGISLLGPASSDAHRLFVVSAGNILNWEADHLTRSDLEPVQDPAHAWNVLTVGAFTDLDSLVDAPMGYEGWSPLAPRGELSPFSRTSVSFDMKKWPIKPEVVMEGGNLAQSPDGTDLHELGVLSLLTTGAPKIGINRQLETANATSAATAQAAHLVAQVMAAYPSLWPEAVRALVVHSAEWTPAMREHLEQTHKKRDKRPVLRRYGMGVPDLLRATRSASDALTLIAQDSIIPFSGGAMREIHFHDLPWPTDVLSELGDVDVRLRVTLSYFIEPNPSRRGWGGRYSYASHGLRFDVRRPTESNADFEKRLNKKALEEEEKRPSSAGESGEWLFGPELQRSSGSLHTDMWYGSAAALAQRGVLAVYPVGGWWKDRSSRDEEEHEARYALIVSIETPGVDADIWTPVAAQIAVPTTIVT